MGICGFNEKIGRGLDLLIEGMIEALEKKVRTSSEEAVLARELIELDNMIAVLEAAKGEVLPEMFVGLDVLAKALFLQVQSDLKSSGNHRLGGACREIGNRFVDLLARTEQMNSGLELESNSKDAIAEKARRVAQWAVRWSRENGVPTGALTMKD